MADLQKRNPSVLWAQRNNLIYLTIEVEDLKIEQLRVDGNKLVLKGANKDAKFDVSLELYADLKWDEHKKANSSRHVELVITKAEEGWWPRLLKSSSKVAWIKVDFDKWLDEDEANEAAGGGGGENPFAQYGLDGMDFNAMSAGGLGDMAGMGGMGGGLGGAMDDDEEDESDTEATDAADQTAEKKAAEILDEGNSGKKASS